jgi:leucyl/phenylalanyl-tRNA--protein transferase
MIPVELLVEAYRCGVFPMGMPDGAIGWFSPDPRGVIPIDARFHIPRGTRRALAKQAFEIRANTAFETVVRACAARRETWINETIVASYTALHEAGFAHSVECWRDNRLAGGLYGVAVGAAFFGESMFHREPDASKVALVALVERLRDGGFTLLDTQWVTPHLAQFGATTLPRKTYLRLLAKAVDTPALFPA